MTKAEEAVKAIKSGDKVFIHSVAATPHHLVDSMVARAHELRDVQIYHLHTEGPAPYTQPEYADSFFTNAFFIGSNVRQAIQEGRGSYIPVFLSEIPRLFRQYIIDLDVVLLSVTPPDNHGYCSLGTSVDASLAAIETAKTVIAQVNSQLPRTHGDSHIHKSRFDYLVYHDQPLPEAQPGEPSEIEAQIGEHITSLVEDGATLQMGIGNIPNAVLKNLTGHKDLGIHTEMFSDGILPLVEKGVITGKYKTKYRGKIVSTFLMGNEKVCHF